MENLKIIECPRDAMQGIRENIPTTTKIKYINELLKVGFDTIDFGSFVSPKSIPQMADTPKVIENLDLSKTKSKLLAIIANERGAEEACTFEQIRCLGYPFSISETFQQRNTNASIEESVNRLEKICDIASRYNKEMVVYLSMAFGNPYGDEWNPEIVSEWSQKLKEKCGIRTIALSDTVGVATPGLITSLFNQLIPSQPDIEFGAHLHTKPELFAEKLKAAYNAGCRRFDGAIKGYGGCPMADDDLVGNMPTEKMIAWFDDHRITTGLNETALEHAIERSSYVFQPTKHLSE
ncbi:MAG: hydroxymethylglutaryl-CoA lyase [Brumimicrobium sp.]|nr:hydroxymethylglutaryl-CoA lyase [Brumimicrobium sp.]